MKILTNGVTYLVRLRNGEERTRHISNLLPLPAAAWGDTYPEPDKVETKIPTKINPTVEVEESDEDDEVTIVTSTTVGEPAQAPLRISTPREVLETADERGAPGTPTKSIPCAGAASPKEFYTLERIIRRGRRDGTPKLLVKWAGYDENSWVTRERLLQDAPSLLHEYERKHPIRRRARR